jgi:hypothetical protein
MDALAAAVPPASARAAPRIDLTGSGAPPASAPRGEARAIRPADCPAAALPLSKRQRRNGVESAAAAFAAGAASLALASAVWVPKRADQYAASLRGYYTYANSITDGEYIRKR